MKIRINKTLEKIIGAVRVSEKVYAKITLIAEQQKASKQDVIRAILDEVIDDIEI